MSLNISPAIRATIIANSAIASALGTYQGAASVHTRRPIPEDAGKPLVLSSDDVSITDEDFVSDRLVVVTRDVFVYGEADRDYRAVEAIGYRLRDLFHRDRFSLAVSGYRVVDVTVQGPRVAPTSDDKICGRMVTLTVRLQPTP